MVARNSSRISAFVVAVLSTAGFSSAGHSSSVAICSTTALGGVLSGLGFLNFTSSKCSTAEENEEVRQVLDNSYFSSFIDDRGFRGMTLGAGLSDSRFGRLKSVDTMQVQSTDGRGGNTENISMPGYEVIGK